jgi:hypothetical protein
MGGLFSKRHGDFVSIGQGVCRSGDADSFPPWGWWPVRHAAQPGLCLPVALSRKRTPVTHTSSHSTAC